MTCSPYVGPQKDRTDRKEEGDAQRGKQMGRGQVQVLYNPRIPYVYHMYIPRALMKLS